MAHKTDAQWAMERFVDLNRQGFMKPLKERRVPKTVKPTLVLKHGAHPSRGYGLIYDFWAGSHKGMLGKNNFGQWYAVAVGEDGADNAIVAEGLATKGKALDAFIKWSKR